MQSDKMCPVTLGNYKTKTPIGRHPWQPPTPAGFEQGVPWRSPCEHSNSSRIRAHATQNAVRQNAFRYLRSRLQHQQASKLWISSRILCNNFLGALPLTPKEGSADMWRTWLRRANTFAGQWDVALCLLNEITQRQLQATVSHGSS